MTDFLQQNATWATRAYRTTIIPGFESVLKRRGTFAHARRLDESQWFSRQRIESLQLDRLKQILRFCWDHSRYYRQSWQQRGLHPSVVQTLSDLRRFPLIDRDAIHRHADDLQVPSAPGCFVRKSTGGSSGVPLHLTIDTNANDRRVAAEQRGYAMAGGGIGVKQTHLWGAAIGNLPLHRRLKDWVHARLLYRRQMLNSFDLSEVNASDFVDRINRFRPEVIVAYTNPMDTLARIILERKLDVWRPKSIITGAEKLHDHQRVRIEEAFGAPLFETYGSREFTLIGAECPSHRGLHITSENLVVEVVDDEGQPLADGEEGNVVITDLFNRSTPFVRYVIGDRAVAGFDGCDCGRGLPLLRKVVGRRLDMLTTMDGRKLPGEFFPHLMKDYAAIRRFQVEQPTQNRVDIRLVVDQRWCDDDRNRLRTAITLGVGPHTEVAIFEVDDIPLTQQGKLRVVVSHVGQPSPSHPPNHDEAVA